METFWNIPLRSLYPHTHTHAHTIVSMCRVLLSNFHIEICRNGFAYVSYTHTHTHSMRTHDLENVISMHADNKYRMMEMRKTLNQIKATTKSQNRFNPRKSQKSSNSNS